MAKTHYIVAISAVSSPFRILTSAPRCAVSASALPPARHGAPPREVVELHRGDAAAASRRSLPQGFASPPPFITPRQSGTIAPVDTQQLLDEPVQTARRLGVEVRLEPFEAPAVLRGAGSASCGARIWC